AATSHTTALQRLAHLIRSLDRGADPNLKPLPRFMIASAVATVTDFSVVATLVHFAGVAPALATIVGCFVGGTIAFSLSRVWAFQATSESPRKQAIRYVFV